MNKIAMYAETRFDVLVMMSIQWRLLDIDGMAIDETHIYFAVLRKTPFLVCYALRWAKHQFDVQCCSRRSSKILIAIDFRLLSSFFLP